MKGTRTTVIIRNDLLAQVRKATGIKRKTDLIHAGLESLLRDEAARTLIGLYASDPHAAAAPRRKPIRSARRRKAA